MATIAFDGSEERHRSPISVHPAFPAIVALWFAVLLGLGSLVLPAVLLDRLAAATGLASLIPAAAPPLGGAVRAALALAAALGGAALGLMIARRVAAAQVAAPETAVPGFGAGTPRPISVHEELGGESVINGHAQPLSRRRALLIAEDDPASDFPDVAPLPGEDPYAAELSYRADPAPPAADEPLELSHMAEDERPAPAAAFAEAPLAIADPDAFADEDQEMTDQQDFQPVSPFQEFAEPAEPVDELDARSNAAGVRGAEPLPFVPRSFSRRAPVRTEEAAPKPEPQTEPEPEPAMQTESEPLLMPVASQPAPAAVHGDWEQGPLADLGLVQLVQRLGSTIEKRREWIAQGSGAAAPVPLPLTGVEAAHAEEAARAKAAYFGSAPGNETAAEPLADALADFGQDAQREADAEAARFALEPLASETAPPEPATPEEAPAPGLRPAFLRSLAAAADDDDEDEGPLPVFSLPLRRPAALATAMSDAQDDPAEEEDEEESLNDDGFRSLLAMRPPGDASHKKSIRIEEPEREADAAPPAPAEFRDHDEPDDRAEPAGIEGAGGSGAFDPPDPASAGAAPADPQAPAEADAALRAALATLQRMSGAA